MESQIKQNENKETNMGTQWVMLISEKINVGTTPIKNLTLAFICYIYAKLLRKILVSDSFSLVTFVF